MHHTLHLTPGELAKYPNKRHLITSKRTGVQAGDILHLTAEREQVAVKVTEVETEGLHAHLVLLTVEPATTPTDAVKEYSPAGPAE